MFDCASENLEVLSRVSHIRSFKHTPSTAERYSRIELDVCADFFFGKLLGATAILCCWPSRYNIAEKVFRLKMMLSD